MSNDPTTLAEPLRTSVLGLLAEANADGTKRVTVVSARRTRDEQIALRRAHCAADPARATQFEIFDKPARDCTPDTARPGTSKHETGKAVDFGGDKRLVAQLAPKYKLVRTVPSEDWHYEHADDRAPGSSESEAPPLGSGGSSVGLGDVAGAAADLIPGVGAVGAGLDAIKSLASFVTDGRNWLRLLAGWLGFALISVGVFILGFDVVRGEGRAGARGIGVHEAAGLATAGGAVG